MRKVCKVISNVLIVLLVATVLILVVPRLFGVKMFGVLSGSMEPEYSVGDLIYAVPTDAEKIEEGDVISFLLNEDGTVATHRVVEIDRENKQIYTKGDANELSDGRPVSYENVLGVVKFSLPVVGKMIVYMNTTPGKIITVTIILALILLIMLLQGEGSKELEEEDYEDFDDYVPKVKRGLEKKRKRNKKTSYQKLKEVEEEPDDIPVKRRSPEIRRQGLAEGVNERRRTKARERPAVEKKEGKIRDREPVRPKKPTTKSEQPSREVYPDIPEYGIPSPTAVGYENNRMTEGDYQYEKLQVCWKMLTLLERMWDETMSVGAAKKPVTDIEYEWQEEQEEGGMDYVPEAGHGKKKHKIS